jgi:methyl-accepting chemotaxis protein
MLAARHITTMRNLKIWERLGIAFVVMLAGTVFITALLIVDKNEPIAFLDSERSGITYLEPLRQLRQWLPVYRRLAETDANLVQPAAEPPSLEHIEKAIRRLDELDRKFGPQLNTTEDFVGIRDEWQRLREGVSNVEVVRAKSTQLNTRVRALTALTGDSSMLMLDSVVTSFYLVTGIVVDLPNGENTLNNLLDFGKTLIDKGQLGSDEYSKLVIMTSSLQRQLDDVNSHYMVAIESNADMAPLETAKREYQAKTLKLLAYLDANLLTQKPIKASTAEYVQSVEEALDANFKLYDATAPLLDHFLEQRVASLRLGREETIIVAVMLALLGLGVMIWVERSIVVPMRQAVAALENSNWSEVAIFSSSHDEVSELIRAATTNRPAAAAPAHTDDGLKQENQELKALVADLVLESRSSKTKSTATS